MKYEILDVHVRTREVEVPDVCPNCGADLTALGSRQGFFSKDIYYVAPGPGGDDADYSVGYELCDGDSGVPHLIACNGCGRGIAQGSYTRGDASCASDTHDASSDVKEPRP